MCFSVQGGYTKIPAKLYFVNEYCGLMNCWIVSGCRNSYKQNLFLPVPSCISLSSKFGIGASGLSSPQTATCVYACVATMTHQKVKIRARNFGRYFRAIMRCAIPNIIKIQKLTRAQCFQTLLLIMWIHMGEWRNSCSTWKDVVVYREPYEKIPRVVKEYGSVGTLMEASK